MTVQELIDILKKLDPDAPLVVHGFFGGFDDLEFANPISLAPNVYQHESWRGKHESLKTLQRYEKTTPSRHSASSELRRSITSAAEGGTEFTPVKAICLEGVSTSELTKYYSD